MVDACASPAIATSCPVVVNLVERYYHDLLDHLVPVASPMVTHGRMIKSCRGPEAKVVFAGPCIAKKDEAGRAETSGAIDAVLTFEELRDMFEQAGIDPADCAADSDHPASPGCDPGPGRARLFPIEGGMMATAGVSSDMIEGPDLCVTGMDNVVALLGSLHRQSCVRMVEIMACAGGCIEGPGISSEIDAWSKKS